MRYHKCAAVLLLLLYLPVALPANQTTASNQASPPSSRSMSPDLLERYRYRYRDPFLAGLLSTSMWGTGQFYCGEYKKGSLFVFGDLVYKGLLVGLVLKFNNKYSSGAADPVRWSEFSAADKGLVIGYVVTWLGLSFWSVSDAIDSAHRFNRLHTLRRQVSLEIIPEGSSPSFHLGWKMPF